MLFPEAGYSFDGTSTTLPDSIGKFVKVLGIPLVMITTYGASVLKTDILQIIHHGYSGGRDEFSNLFANSTERTVCLWPTSAAKFNDDRRTGKDAATGFNKILRDAENCFHFHAEQNLTVDLIDLTVTSEGVVLTADHDGKSYSADAE